MKTPSLTTIADRVPESLGGALDAGRNLAGDAAAHAPDLSGVSESIGRAARSSADTVSDTVADVVHELPGQIARVATAITAVTPFLDRRPARQRPRSWVGPVALVAAIVVLALWWKRRSPPAPAAPVRPAAVTPVDPIPPTDN